MSCKIHQGDCLQILPTLEANSIDSIVTDPPYGLSFMGREWDHGVPGEPFWREALRVAKPGAHLLAFGGTRTYHRLACAIEDAGWEIRDCMMWLYGSGFPKSLDVSKAIDKAAGAEREIIGKSARKIATGEAASANLYAQDEWTKRNARMGEYLTAPATDGARQWSGWGTALKPAWEPIFVCRKPLTGTVVENVQAWGTGAINIDASRISAPDGVPQFRHRKDVSVGVYGDGLNGTNRTGKIDTSTGRWPANVVLSHTPDCQCIGTKEVKGATGGKTSGQNALGQDSGWNEHENRPVGIGRYTNTDGMETVEAWECVGPQTYQRVRTRIGNSTFDLTVATEAELLAFVQLLTCVLKDDSRTVDKSVDQAGECEHAATALGSQDSLADCPSCLHFCDGLLHQVRAAAQGSAQQLADALESALCQARSLKCNHSHQFDVRPSSSDDSLLRNDCCDTDWSRSESDPIRFVSRESVCRKIRKEGPVPLPSEPSGSSEESNSGEPCTTENPSRNGHRLDVVRRLCLLSADLACRSFINEMSISLDSFESNGCPVRQLDEQSGFLTSRPAKILKRGAKTGRGLGYHGNKTPQIVDGWLGDSGGASRFFYCAKASKADRGPGNNHPTVKPLALMQYLIKLVTPPKGMVLDPFAGSGSTLLAAQRLGFSAIGIEREADYVAIIERRLREDAPLFAALPTR